jgi:hypothetical protein
MNETKWVPTFAERLQEGDLVRYQIWSTKEMVEGTVRDVDVRQVTEQFSGLSGKAVTFIFTPSDGTDEIHALYGGRFAVWIGISVDAEVTA